MRRNRDVTFVPVAPSASAKLVGQVYDQTRRLLLTKSSLNILCRISQDLMRSFTSSVVRCAHASIWASPCEQHILWLNCIGLLLVSSLKSHVQPAANRPQSGAAPADAHKRFGNQDKINIKAQLVFETCWRKLEKKWSGVRLPGPCQHSTLILTLL